MAKKESNPGPPKGIKRPEAPPAPPAPPGNIVRGDYAELTEQVESLKETVASLQLLYAQMLQRDEELKDIIRKVSMSHHYSSYGSN